MGLESNPKEVNKIIFNFIKPVFPTTEDHRIIISDPHIFFFSIRSLDMEKETADT